LSAPFVPSVPIDRPAHTAPTPNAPGIKLPLEVCRLARCCKYDRECSAEQRTAMIDATRLMPADRRARIALKYARYLGAGGGGSELAERGRGSRVGDPIVSQLRVRTGGSEMAGGGDWGEGGVGPNHDPTL
jgi:hypothetical protein